MAHSTKFGVSRPRTTLARVSTIEQPAQTTDQAGAGTRSAAIGIVLFLLVIGGLVLLTFAFRTNNANYSVDGNTATSSSYSGDDQAPSQ